MLVFLDLIWCGFLTWGRFSLKGEVDSCWGKLRCGEVALGIALRLPYFSLRLAMRNIVFLMAFWCCLHSAKTLLWFVLLVLTQLNVCFLFLTTADNTKRWLASSFLRCSRALALDFRAFLSSFDDFSWRGAELSTCGCRKTWQPIFTKSVVTLLAFKIEDFSKQLSR